MAEPSGLASPDVPLLLAEVLAPSIGHMGTSCGDEKVKLFDFPRYLNHSLLYMCRPYVSKYNKKDGNHVFTINRIPYRSYIDEKNKSPVEEKEKRYLQYTTLEVAGMSLTFKCSKVGNGW